MQMNQIHLLKRKANEIIMRSVYQKEWKKGREEIGREMYVSQPSVNIYNNGRNVNDGNDGNDDTGEETRRNLNESNWIESFRLMTQTHTFLELKP